MKGIVWRTVSEKNLTKLGKMIDHRWDKMLKKIGINSMRCSCMLMSLKVIIIQIAMGTFTIEHTGPRVYIVKVIGCVCGGRIK